MKKTVYWVVSFYILTAGIVETSGQNIKSLWVIKNKNYNINEITYMIDTLSEAILLECVYSSDTSTTNFDSVYTAFSKQPVLVIATSSERFEDLTYPLFNQKDSFTINGNYIGCSSHVSKDINGFFNCKFQNNKKVEHAKYELVNGCPAGTSRKEIKTLNSNWVKINYINNYDSSGCLNGVQIRQDINNFRTISVYSHGLLVSTAEYVRNLPNYVEDFINGIKLEYGNQGELIQVSYFEHKPKMKKMRHTIDDF